MPRENYAITQTDLPGVRKELNRILSDISTRLSAISGSANIPSSPGAPGKKGDIVWDKNYIYVCTAKNTWKRANVSSWD